MKMISDMVTEKSVEIYARVETHIIQNLIPFVTKVVSKENILLCKPSQLLNLKIP